MDKKYTNPCTRCGKERVHLKTWSEKVTNSSGLVNVVTYTETVCPDKDCQKIVVQKLKVESDKKRVLDKEREKRQILNKANRKNKKKQGK